MQSVRSRLSYANVVSTLALFLVLGGATAIAATGLKPNSVGTAQLKPQAVTGAKIKPGAVNSSKIADGNVTTGKLAGGAVTSDKIAGGAVTSDRIAEGAVGNGKIGNGAVTLDKLGSGLPFARVVARIRGTGAVSWPGVNQPAVTYPLGNPTFTQPAGETHMYVASAQAQIPNNCDPASAVAQLKIDAGRGNFLDELVAEGEFFEQDQPGTTTFQFSSLERSRGLVTGAPASPTQHTFSIQLISASCNSVFGTGAGIKMTGAQIDVIGIR